MATVSKSTVSSISPQDFQTYNRLAEQMSFFHSILRRNWHLVLSGCAPSSKMRPAELVRHASQFCQHLSAHHDIEESRWFPVLGRRMPGFRPDGFAKAQHAEMHKGLDVMQAYVQGVHRGEHPLRREELRRIMDSFGDLLWNHMDEEVVELGAENMSKFWSKDEMARLPF
ncbi:hypothetical protein HD553DRAFT_295625 [Filobasidium floriforme]|uniref:uncharacterized protein n=1 Tax=Filobasidium floriforme TaxID=5210 RepID=UPI001E8E2ED5|nr:uncharacterized protein HD553DRAFT_295625 [Filobasidium floriforme]KAH8085147.1 hypothetical protein HD553DRAFT_295625 [Filobasidium floriforme]